MDARPSATGIGADVARIEGRLKVTGAARYASDADPANPAYAFLVTSQIARGRVVRIDEAEARAQDGVLAILTHREVGERVGTGELFASGGYMGSTIAPLASDRVWHAGQIVAIVVADSYEIARDAAHRLRIEYEAEPPAATFDSPGVDAVAVADVSEGHEDPEVGDAATAFEKASVKIDQWYGTPTQHHNPIELFTTACEWRGDRLTVWEASQNVRGLQHAVAGQLGIDPANVHVISHHVGGAFGSRGSATQRTALIAFAAREVGRAVKLAATRDQGFTIATYRAETRHHVKLAAARDGRLQSLTHDGFEVTSRADNYSVAGTDASTRLYACPNVASRVSIVRADRNTPGFMRSPPEVPYLYALESAMDELAFALGMDPVELRRVNDTRHEPIRNLPYTSRSMMECFDAASAAFGWAKRDPRPGSMRDGDWRIGWGCAATAYPTVMSPATARISLAPDGSVRVATAAHDIGTGAYTAIALTTADLLGVDLDRVEVALGDSELPPGPIASGSNTTASVCNAIANDCAEIRKRQAERPGANETIEVIGRNVPHGIPEEGAFDDLARGMPRLNGGAWMEDRVQFAFGAEFVELRIHALTGEIRCPRIVGAFAAGRIVSRRTAESQLIGGMIWGLSSALHEATDIDPRTARYMNADLAEYLIPVNADVAEVRAIVLAEDDREVNPLSIKGLGELGNVGTNAAVANAVFHATGKRIRDLPIRIEDMLG